MPITDNVIHGYYGDEKATCASAANTFGVPVGTKMELPDGRVYRLARASTAAAIGAGHVISAPDPNASADMDVELLVAAAVGDTTLTVRLPSTVAANAYAGGYVIVNDGDGEGHIYKIKENTAITASGAATATTVTLEDNDALAQSVAKSAAGTESLVGLIQNPYMDVIVRATTPDERAVGVTTVSASAGYYFWAQTWGVAAVLAGATVCVAFSTVVSDTAGTAGAAVFQNSATAAVLNEQVIGYATNVAAVNGDYQAVFLTISP
jgi:hypothetical protein